MTGMDDPYPSHIEIEVDRDGLRKYLRVKWFCSWALIVGLIGLGIGPATVSKTIDHGVQPSIEVLITIASSMALGLCAGFVCGAALYFALSHWLAVGYANTLALNVEGPFLRIRHTFGARTDRRLHFRAIVDYAIQQDVLMRLFAIESLIMTTTGGGPTSTITIPGIKNGLKTRDLLSEVDRLRENAP
jgi:hypothetical protein